MQAPQERQPLPHAVIPCAVRPDFSLTSAVEAEVKQDDPPQGALVRWISLVLSVWRPFHCFARAGALFYACRACKRAQRFLALGAEPRRPPCRAPALAKLPQPSLCTACAPASSRPLQKDHTGVVKKERMVKADKEQAREGRTADSAGRPLDVLLVLASALELPIR